METTIADVASPYDAIAPGYELLTADWDYEPWIDAIEALAERCGLTGRRLLDVACGTGNSFLPFVTRGYTVAACDASPAMAAIAAAKAGDSADVAVADMRALPHYGTFDLVTCLDDAINHLTTPRDVIAAFAGVRANLADRGLFIFDVNTLAAYRSAPTIVVEDEERIVIWHGEMARLEAAGGTTLVRMQLLTRGDDDCWSREVAEWGHRHYDLATLRTLLARAGLRLVAVRGQRTGGRLELPADEQRHPKLLLVATRA